MEKRKRSHHVLTWKIAFYLFMGLLVSNGLFYYLMSRPLGRSYAGALLVLKDTLDASLGQAASIGMSVLALLCLLVFVAALLMSHRVSGPIYRFERTAESVAGGDFSGGVRLRRMDEMTDVAEEMDKAIRDVRARLARVDALAEELHEEAARLDRAGSHEYGSALCSSALPRITEGLKEIRAQVGHFRI